VRLEPIVRREFSQRDREQAQERVAQEVEHSPELFLARYVKDPRSLGGRYVNSDLMKEMFEVYRASRESRNRYNTPVHNAAAVLASEQYRRSVSDNWDPGRDVAFFLTGIPGAGKTTSVLRRGELPEKVRVLYEGQFAAPKHAIAKIELAVAAGLRPAITVVHTPAESALQNTLRRFAIEGRGASVEAMASIQGRLPDGLRAVHDQFGDSVELLIVDRRGIMTKELYGWQHLSELESEGTYEQIKSRLTNILDGYRREGRIKEEAYEQAFGKVPRDFPRRMA
jgi:Zeta toxin